ncbi:MAG: stage II sporulation protein M [Candidatus Bathyarchaeales archaeon]
MFFLLSFIVTIAGVLTPLSTKEAEEINKEMEQMQESVSNAGAFRGTAFIFGNNFMLCLLFFIPIAGPFFGCYVLYSTGVVIAAQSISASIHPVLTLLLLFIFPFTWLEFLAYSAAFSQSVWLTWRIIQHKARREFVNTCIMISICAIMLLAAAIVEIMAIQALSSAV